MTESQRLYGRALGLCGSDAKLRPELNILKRLTKQYGAAEVERMIAGAQLLGWRSLRSLGSAEGLGRRMALGRYWREQEKRPGKLPDRVRAILREMSE